jgi:hypothetical protein
MREVNEPTASTCNKTRYFFSTATADWEEGNFVGFLVGGTPKQLTD